MSRVTENLSKEGEPPLTHVYSTIICMNVLHRWLNDCKKLNEIVYWFSAAIIFFKGAAKYENWCDEQSKWIFSVFKYSNYKRIKYKCAKCVKQHNKSEEPDDKLITYTNRFIAHELRIRNNKIFIISLIAFEFNNRIHGSIEGIIRKRFLQKIKKKKHHTHSKHKQASVTESTYLWIFSVSSDIIHCAHHTHKHWIKFLYIQIQYIFICECLCLCMYGHFVVVVVGRCSFNLFIYILFMLIPTFISYYECVKHNGHIKCANWLI